MKQTDKKLNSHILYSLLAGVHLAAVPLYADIPLTIVLLAATLGLWQAYIIKNKKKNIGKIAQIVIITVIFFIILLTYRRLFNQEASIALVILMTTLKLFETKNTRDCYIIIYSSLFILASNFFLSQSAGLTIYVFFIVIFLMNILIALSDRLDTVPVKTRLNLSTRYFFYAMPLMLVLFVLFPRMPGPLWGLPKDVFSSQTGLSEEMAPGSINRLISSSKIAFRVKFNGDIPPHNQLYWRGAVLSKYDGKTWRRGDAPESTSANIAFENITFENTDAKRLSYTVTLEPTYLNWLLSLEYPIANNRQYSINREAMLITKKIVSNVINYSVVSQTNARNEALFAPESYKNRLLPSHLNTRTKVLAKKLLNESNYNKQQYIDNVLNYYRNNEFFYTLNPGLLGQNAMDDFLFRSRRGFCEHYASSFVYLMRAVGLPARVIIGYQGGTINPLDDYMIVRQSDAHAWSEVWLDDHWQRVDPTAAVSPDRIEQGVLNAGLETNKLPLLLVSNSAFIKNAAFLYDSFQNSWNQWVISFDEKKQGDLLKALGFKNATASDLILLLVICLSLTAMLIAWILLKQTSTEKDRIQHHYNMLCLKLQRHGIQRQLYEGPLDFEARINKELRLTDKSKRDLNFLFKAYRSLHYGKSSNIKLADQYIRKVKMFKLKKIKRLSRHDSENIRVATKE